MTDIELYDYLIERENVINTDEYLYICTVCTQLKSIEYKDSDGYFEAVSDDNHCFKFYISNLFQTN